MRHVAEQVKRVMLVRAEVIKQLNLARRGQILSAREDEAIVAQYVQAAVALDVGDSVQEAIDRGNPT